MAAASPPIAVASPPAAAGSPVGAPHGLESARRPDGQALVAPSARRVLALVSGGYLVASWAMNPVSTILPTISADLQIDVARTGWLMNAYFVALVGWVLIAGRLGDAFGHGRVFRLGALLFALGSLFGALPGGYPLLLLGRATQGLGSALIFGTSLAIVTAAFQGRALAQAVGLLTASAGFSSIFGVWISTTLVQSVSWHWTFVLPVALGLVVAATGRDLPSVRRLRSREVDWLGGGLLLAALTLLLLGLNHLHEGAETFEAGAPYHLTVHAAALALFATFVWRQATTPRPLIKLSLFGNVRLSTGVLANGVAHSSMLATSLLIPFLLERGRGYTPSETQRLMLAMQIALIAASATGGWLYSRLNSPFIGAGALSLIAAGLLVLGRWGADASYEALLPVVAVLGLGLGTFTTVNNTAVMSSAAADQHGFASGLVELTRQLGHSLGVSASAAVLAGALAAASVPADGYRTGFAEAAWAMGLVCAAGVTLILYPHLRLPQAPSRRCT